MSKTNANRIVHRIKEKIKEGGKRNDIVPLYCEFILESMKLKDPLTEQCIVANQSIIIRWSESALIYIKEKAWKTLKSKGKKVK